MTSAMAGENGLVPCLPGVTEKSSATLPPYVTPSPAASFFSSSVILLLLVAFSSIGRRGKRKKEKNVREGSSLESLLSLLPLQNSLLLCLLPGSSLASWWPVLQPAAVSWAGSLPLVSERLLHIITFVARERYGVAL